MAATKVSYLPYQILLSELFLNLALYVLLLSPVSIVIKGTFKRFEKKECLVLSGKAMKRKNTEAQLYNYIFTLSSLPFV